MNKKDLQLIIVLILISVNILFGFKIVNQKENKKAIVYYENKEILSIDLNDKQEKTYEVEGYNGKVKIVSKNGKVKVLEEKSPLHLCSKQGYISASYETIVCLPNKIVIKIKTSNNLDTIVK